MGNTIGTALLEVWTGEKGVDETNGKLVLQGLQTIYCKRSPGSAAE